MSFRGGRGGPRGSWKNSPAGSRGGPPPKRPRHDDEEEEMETFEDRLAGMLDEEEDMAYGGQEVPLEVEESLACQQDRFLRWRRPDPPAIDVSKVKCCSKL